MMILNNRGPYIEYFRMNGKTSWRIQYQEYFRMNGKTSWRIQYQECIGRTLLDGIDAKGSVTGLEYGHIFPLEDIFGALKRLEKDGAIKKAFNPVPGSSYIMRYVRE